MATTPERSFTALGAFLRQVRERRGLTAKEVAARAGMRPAQLTHLQRGGNAAWSYYEAAARAMGFRGALEMFMSGGDDQTATLLRVWRALPDDEARTDALQLIRAMHDGALGPAAT